MTTQDIYRLAVQLGIKYDLRGEGQVKEYLNRTRKKFSSLNDEEKAEFDQDKLVNPYSDTRVLVANNNEKEIKRIVAGVDIGGAELLLAEKMGVDLVISHHPTGKALVALHSVMDMQARIFANSGVPINIAESLMKSRMSEVGRGVHSTNYNRQVDMARILGLDFMCTHTTADNLAAAYLNNLMSKKKPEYVEDILRILKEVPEYKIAIKDNAGPTIFLGNPENSCGKILVEFTGGTSPSKEMYAELAKAGVGTVIVMHMGEPSFKEAKDLHINVINAGHMSSDSLGMNLFLDEVEKQGIEIVALSGINRIKRF